MVGRRVRGSLVSWVVLLFLGVPTAHGSEGLDIRDWLSRPGVKLVVVEFYSVYCKPCMEAVPRWRKLHEKYRNQGLRLLVVSADPGVCAQPDWSPDEVVCDEHQLIQNAWKVDSLPQAFVWDWRGRMLEKRAHVGQVEKRVADFFENELRISVEETTGPKGRSFADGEMVQTLLRGELARGAKFDVVMDRDEAEIIRDRRKETHESSKESEHRCELGKEISANSVLISKVLAIRNGAQLVLELLSVERGCIIAFARTPIVEGDYQTAVVDVVGKLLRKLVHVQDPRGVDRLVAGQGEQKGARLALSVKPKGAKWVLDGRESGVLDPKKPITMLQVAPGKHEIKFSLEGYISVVAEVYVEQGDLKTVSETLVPFVAARNQGAGIGFLNIISEPEEGARVFLDGKDTGKRTPVTLDDVSVGEHAVMLRLRFFKDYVGTVSVPRNDVTRINARMEPDFGSFKVDSVPAGADVYLDDRRVGKTPYAKKRVQSKAYKLRLSYPNYHDLEGTVFVTAGEHVDETFELSPAFGSLHVTAFGVEGELPGAEVALNYEDKGKTPLVLDELPSGEYELTVKAPFYKDLRQTVEVRDGDVTATDVELEPDFGTVRLDVTPDSVTLEVDGQDMGAGDRLLRLHAGEHTLKFAHPDPVYKPVTRKVALSVLESVALEVTLEPMTGELFVFVEPAGGTLYLDDELVGVLPQKVSNVVVGRHTLRVEREGYQPVTREVVVKEGHLHKVKFEPAQKAVIIATCAPGDNTIYVDGKPLGSDEAKATGLDDGPHEVTCEAPGYAQAGAVQNVTMGNQYKVDLRLDTPELLQTYYESKKGSHILWGTVGVVSGAAMAGTAVWTFLEYQDASKRFDESEEAFDTSFDVPQTEAHAADMRSARDDMQLYSILGWSLAGVGAAAMIFGIIEYITIPDKPASVSVVPMATPGSQGLMLEWGW